MDFDRLEFYAAIDFISAVIPKDAKTGKNCLFVRVEGDKLILTGGGPFSVKRAIIVSQNTTTKTKKLPERFMIPRADLLAFREMMKEHKADCKRLAKNDPSYMLVSVTDDELVSCDGMVTFQQPAYQFKELESLFQIKKGPVSEMPVMTKELTAVLKGFKESEKVNATYTDEGGLIYYEQGYFEAILLPPVEKKKEQAGEQTTIDGETE